MPTPTPKPNPSASCFTPIASLYRHPRLAVRTFVAALLVTVPWAWFKGEPIWQTTGVIHIAPRAMRNLKEDSELEYLSNNQYRQFAQHQARTFTRHDILHRTLDTPQAHRWLTRQPSRDRALDVLRDKLIVTPVIDTYLMTISLTDSQSSGLADVINALIETYLSTSRAEQLFGAADRVTILKQREQALLLEIDHYNQQRIKLADIIGSAHLNANGESEAPFDKTLQALREQLATARIRRQETQSRLTALIRGGDADVSLAGIYQSVQSDPGLTSLKAGLNKRRAELLTVQSGLSSDHPGYQDSLRELAEIDTALSAYSTRLSDEVKAALVARLNSTLDAARALESAVEHELASATQQAGKHARALAQAQLLSSEIEQRRRDLTAVRERLDFFALEGESIGFARLVTPAMTPNYPTGPGRKKLAIMALLMSLVAGLMAPLAKDFLRKRIHTVGDAEAAFGEPALGWVVAADEPASALLAQHQTRLIAQALLRIDPDARSTVVAFSSLTPCSPCHALVRHIADTLVRLGASVIVLHRDEDTAHFPDTLDQARLPAVITIDKLPAQLAPLRDHYRFVLIDAPPLFTHPESELLLRAAGHAVVVIQAETHRPSQVAQAASRLATLAPQAVGFIVQGVQPYLCRAELGHPSDAHPARAFLRQLRTRWRSA